MDFYALGLLFLTISTTVGSINFVVTMLKMRAPGMSINRMPIMVWSTVDDLVHGALRAPVAVGRVRLSLLRSPPRDALLRQQRRAAARCSGSICSGSSGIPGSTSSCSPQWGWRPMIIPTFCRRPLAGYTYVVHVHDHDGADRLRRVGPSHVRDGAAADGDELLQRGESDDRRFRAPSRCSRGSPRSGTRSPSCATPMLFAARLRAAVRDRRRVRRDDRRRSLRLAAHRHVLRGRAHPLRAHRHQRLPGRRRRSTTGSRR